MSWFGGITIKTDNSVPGGFEELTVTDESCWFQRGRIKPYTGDYAGMSAKAGLISLEGGDIRFRMDGLYPPTSTSGHYMSSGDTFLIIGTQALLQFRAIRVGEENGLLTATYFF
jgi:hypothetical protein